MTNSKSLLAKSTSMGIIQNKVDWSEKESLFGVQKTISRVYSPR